MNESSGSRKVKRCHCTRLFSSVLSFGRMSLQWFLRDPKSPDPRYWPVLVFESIENLLSSDINEVSEDTIETMRMQMENIVEDDTNLLVYFVYLEDLKCISQKTIAKRGFEGDPLLLHWDQLKPDVRLKNMCEEEAVLLECAIEISKEYEHTKNDLNHVFSHDPIVMQHQGDDHDDGNYDVAMEKVVVPSRDDEIHLIKGERKEDTIWIEQGKEEMLENTRNRKEDAEGVGNILRESVNSGINDECSDIKTTATVVTQQIPSNREDHIVVQKAKRPKIVRNEFPIDVEDSGKPSSSSSPALTVSSLVENVSCLSSSSSLSWSSKVFMDDDVIAKLLASSSPASGAATSSIMRKTHKPNYSLFIEMWSKRVLENVMAFQSSNGREIKGQLVSSQSFGISVWSTEYFTQPEKHKSDSKRSSGATCNGGISQELTDNNDSYRENENTRGYNRVESYEKSTESTECNSSVVDGEKLDTQGETQTRRSTRAPKSVLVNDMIGELSASGKSLSHSLITPILYGMLEDKPKQPFQIIVHPQVTLLCDIHSHLSTAEVIGLLAGKWDPQEKILYIQASFPCASTQRIDDGALDVELDPVAEYETRDVINGLGLTVVGWYHSHPKFRPNPSTIDIFNQSQYQSLMHDENTNLDPFVGLIVSTYDSKLSSHVSDHQWFHVAKTEDIRSTTAGKTVDIPMRLEVEILKLNTALTSSSALETIAHEDFIKALKRGEKTGDGESVEVDLLPEKKYSNLPRVDNNGNSDVRNRKETTKPDVFNKLFCGICNYVCTCNEHRVDNEGKETKLHEIDGSIHHMSTTENNGTKVSSPGGISNTKPLRLDYAKIQQEALDMIREEQLNGQKIRPKRGTKKRQLYDDSFETQKTKEMNKMKRLAMLEKKKTAEAPVPPLPPPPTKKKREKKQERTLKQTKADEKERKIALQEKLFKYTLVDHLVDEKRNSSIAARIIILNCRPSISCLLLSIISIIFYYCKYDKRINLNGKFKGISILEKIQVSIRNYLNYFNLNEIEENIVVNGIIHLLVHSWTEI